MLCYSDPLVSGGFFFIFLPIPVLYHLSLFGFLSEKIFTQCVKCNKNTAGYPSRKGSTHDGCIPNFKQRVKEESLLDNFHYHNYGYELIS